MFGFSFFSMNIVYLLFAAVYMVSFGVLSYNKIGEKLKGKPAENEAEVFIDEPQGENPENTLHLFADIDDSALLPSDNTIHFSREYLYPPCISTYYHCTGIICSNLFSRPPPSLS
jgi:hypothetical protein